MLVPPNTPEEVSKLPTKQKTPIGTAWALLGTLVYPHDKGLVLGSQD